MDQRGTRAADPSRRHPARLTSLGNGRTVPNSRALSGHCRKFTECELSLFGEIVLQLAGGAIGGVIVGALIEWMRDRA